MTAMRSDDVRVPVANHFLISGDVLPLIRSDAGATTNGQHGAGWDRPQEDEFALCMLGAPSPYLSVAFRTIRRSMTTLDLEGLPPRELKRWKRTFVRLLQELTVRHKGKRLVLKSPTHTARVRVLLDLFPDSRFVHIVRDPYVVFSSTVHLWKSLYETHGLQKPTFAGLEERVLATFVRMYARLEQDRCWAGAVPRDEVRSWCVTARRGAACTSCCNSAVERVRPRLEAYCAANQRHIRRTATASRQSEATVARQGRGDPALRLQAAGEPTCPDRGWWLACVGPVQASRLHHGGRQTIPKQSGATMCITAVLGGSSVRTGG
jgi:hypothetical protein